MLSLIFLLFFRKEVYDMAIIYATLIIKGRKVFSDVPMNLKEQVKEILTDLDCSDLAK